MQFKNLEDSGFFGTKSIELDEDMIKLMNKFFRFFEVEVAWLVFVVFVEHVVYVDSDLVHFCFTLFISFVLFCIHANKVDLKKKVLVGEEN